jgi:endo-1,4-beta-xylanase
MRPFIPTAIAIALALSIPAVCADTLRSIAERKGLKIGVMALDATWNTPQQKTLVASEFNVVTVGTFWKRTHPAPGVYDWSVTDAVVQWADSEDLGIHLHPLLYPSNDQTPAWVQARPHAEALAILEEHITTAMDRYRGKVDVWDVVNEAVSPSGAYRDCWWLQALGPNYIVEAFRLARQHDPAAVLVYNDHDMELDNAYQNAKWNQVQTILQTLAAEDLIDGLGWQLHTNPSEVLGGQFALADRMEWVESLGLKNFVTELDMEIGVEETALQRQGEAYQKVAEVWLDHHNGGWFETWGVYDKHTWLGSAKRPLLFDEQYQPKPAYDGVLNALLEDTRADFNQDGAIDGADFLEWQRGLGAIDADYDQGDLLSWQRQFAAPEAGQAYAVPEPNAQCWHASAVALLAALTRTRYSKASTAPAAWRRSRRALSWPSAHRLASESTESNARLAADSTVPSGQQEPNTIRSAGAQLGSAIDDASK